MKHILLGAALVGACLLGGCSDKPKDSTEVAEQANEAMVDSGATALQGEDKEDDSEMMIHAAEGGMFEIQASKLAQQKATSAELKKFADMMVTDHTKAADELKAMAASKNVQLPVALGNDMQQKLDDLAKKSGVDFDHEYASLMQDAHEKDVDLFKEGSEDCEDADVKGWFAKTLPTIQHHLSMIKPMEEKQDERKDAM